MNVACIFFFFINNMQPMIPCNDFINNAKSLCISIDRVLNKSEPIHVEAYNLCGSYFELRPRNPTNPKRKTPTRKYVAFGYMTTSQFNHITNECGSWPSKVARILINLKLFVQLNRSLRADLKIWKNKTETCGLEGGDITPSYNVSEIFRIWFFLFW